MSEPIQTSLPIVGPAKLIAGPIFLCFELPGKPGHKGRHRSRIVVPKEAWTYPRDPRAPKYMTEAGVKKIWIQQYPDPQTESYESVVSEYAGLLMRGNPPTTKPLALMVHAFREIPMSWSARDREGALVGAIRPTSRPDGDNYLKMVQDALNKVVYMDDSQIVNASVLKEYSDKPALRIELREMVAP